MRNGDWMHTFTGMKFYPLDPSVDDIKLRDIAHALAMTCRYNGHCKIFYSVAEHCVRMAASPFGLPGSQKWRLFHDAAEAYLCDLPTPIKRNFPEYKEAENRLLSIIGEAFSLGAIDEEAIKQADLIMLATEKRDILNDGPDWGIQLPEPLPEIIFPLSWQDAESRFLDAARRLLL